MCHNFKILNIKNKTVLKNYYKILINNEKINRGMANIYRIYSNDTEFILKVLNSLPWLFF